jgi:dTDP-4-dehydrorhamnose reductase
MVVGADGLVGGALARALTANGRIVHCTTRREPVSGGRLFLDLADSSVAHTPLPDVEAAIICASVNGFARCRTDPAAAYRVNVEGTELLTRRLVSRGCRILYLSSSAVFDFSRPHMRADCPVCPTTAYGMNKALAERMVLTSHAANAVVRLTKVLARNAPLFQSWVKALRSRRAVTAYSDLHFCPITEDYAAKAIIKILQQGDGGIYQVSGADDISYANAARHLARRMGIDEDRVIAERAVSHGIPQEEVATFTSLDASRFTALSGEPAPEPLDVLDRVFAPVVVPAA